MTTILVSGGIGFLIGLLVFQRPQWATDLFNSLWAKAFGPKVS